jgi:xanthine dehydrogenase small subunit
MTGTICNEIRFKRNGEWRGLRPDLPREMLLDHIRLRERACGTKEGCNEGDCGACTVVLKRIVDGKSHHQPVNACILFTAQIDGAELITIEDLARDGALHPVQEALVKHHGSQCGFCTPGIVMSLYALHENTTGPVTRNEVLTALQGNLCRCTGYRPIVDAALEACAGPRRKRPLFATDVAPADDDEGFLIGDGDRFFAAPATEDALADLLIGHPDAIIVSGATDVGLWITKRLDDPGKIIWTGKIAGFDRIAHQARNLFIGAGATHAKLMPHFAAIDPDLEDIMLRFGSMQVRASGTIGGNIANGSPIGDLAPCLIALDASLHLRRGAERRSIPLEDFFIRYGVQDRAASEFVTGLTVPDLPDGHLFRAFKLSKRREEDISSVLLAVQMACVSGSIAAIRIACGGLAGTPKRALATEKALLGCALADGAGLDAAISLLETDYQPLSDMRASASYRMSGAKALLRRALIEALGPDIETRLTPRRERTALLASAG